MKTTKIITRREVSSAINEGLLDFLGNLFSTGIPKFISDMKLTGDEQKAISQAFKKHKEFLMKPEFEQMVKGRLKKFPAEQHAVKQILVLLGVSDNQEQIQKLKTEIEKEIRLFQSGQTPPTTKQTPQTSDANQNQIIKAEIERDLERGRSTPEELKKKYMSGGRFKDFVPPSMQDELKARIPQEFASGQPHQYTGGTEEPQQAPRQIRGSSRRSGGGGIHYENKKGTNNMTLTQDRLKQIIKEELEAIMNEVEEVNPEDAAVASLEKQLAEAKAKAAKAKMKKGETVGKRGSKGQVANTVPSGFHTKGMKKGKK